MSLTDSGLVVLAGMVAGALNTIVGSGSLITFPVLLTTGMSPVTANIANSVGLVPGSISGVVGYRHELRGQLARVARLGLATLAGATCGAVLLLTLDADAFDAVVPVLIMLGCVLVVAQPLVERLADRSSRHTDGGPVAMLAAFAIGAYGGYFGAAQGVLLLGVMGMLFTDTLQNVNGLKNALQALANTAAAGLFVLRSDIAWQPVVLIAAGSVIGALLGARYGRNLPAVALRTLVVIVGTVTTVVWLAKG